MRAVRFPGGPTWLDVRIGPMKPWVVWSELRRGQGPPEAGGPPEVQGEQALPEAGRWERGARAVLAGGCGVQPVISSAAA